LLFADICIQDGVNREVGSVAYNMIL